MADHLNDSDSDDEFIMYLAAKTRKVKVLRPRPNHLTEWSDEEFVVRFRFTKATVLYLLTMVEARLDTPTNRAIPAINQLLLALRFYALGSMLVSVGDFFGVHKSTASRIIKSVTVAIGSLRPLFVTFPTTDEEKSDVRAQFYRMNRFPHVIGAIDCTHIRIQSPGGDMAEVYRNHKGWFSLNVQTICDSQMRIQDIVARWPGSAHDQTIFNNSSIHARFERGEFGDSVLLGDSGYALKPYLLTPVRNTNDPGEVLYNEGHTRTRTIIERKYGVWKRRFPCLSLGLRLKVETVQEIIVACAVLHNLAIKQKEPQPPHDVDLPVCNILDDNINQVDVQNVLPNSNNVRNCIINYYRQFL